MDKKSANNLEENVIDNDKRNSRLDRIKNDPKNNYGSYAALIGILLTISGIIIKGMSTIVIAGYNNYFSINSTYNHISEASILSNLFNILFVSIVLLVPNFLMAYVILKAKNLWKLILNVISIFVLSMIVLFIFTCIMLDYNIFLIWKDVTLSDILSFLRALSILCLFIYYFGLIIGISIRNKWFDKHIGKAVATIDKKINPNKNKKTIIKLLICLFVIIGIYFLFQLGESFAVLKHDYRLINNNNQVILAEKDGMYLCADCKYDESSKKLEIYSAKQICINSEDVEMNVIKVYDVSISKDS